MNRFYARPILVAGALSLLGMPWGGSDHEISKVHAAPWIAPAPQQELSANWVQDVAREFRQPQFRNIFMNIPGGSPQSTILDLLNEAAEGLENGEPGYARHLVRRAINVLDRSAGRGWYTASEIQPIQAMILKYAKRGFSEADQNWKSRNRNHPGNRQRSSNRWQEEGVRLFNPDEPNISGNRWDGYTSDHWQGSGGSYDRVQKRNIRQNTENFDRSRDRASKGSFRDREQNLRNQGENPRMERGGTQRYYSDDFYYSDYPYEDRGRWSESSRHNRNSYRDQMPWAMEQDRRLHARGNERFYSEQPRDRGKQRPYERGPGQDEYFESTTRNQSRGFNR
ncbi:MAG: hypothetical protein H6750_13565 [Nitrospiraceae bacterium]|nr:hypothetical protein [Nitrospira sp.]MCA9455318.1 hypothetical protein [Nitrospira sp.]MCB9775333.1 hypothetical protein [Nitrospiraceae bacterium]